jgi:hypothetical protein
MSEKQTTFFTVNCAEKLEFPNQWYSNIFEYGAVAVFHSDLLTPQPLELKSHQQASKSMIRPPESCQVSMAPYRICSPLVLQNQAFVIRNEFNFLAHP